MKNVLLYLFLLLNLSCTNRFLGENVAKVNKMRIVEQSVKMGKMERKAAYISKNSY